MTTPREHAEEAARWLWGGKIDESKSVINAAHEWQDVALVADPLHAIAHALTAIALHLTGGQP